MTPEFRVGCKEGKRKSQEAPSCLRRGMTVFADPLARLFDDPDHSKNERRELIIGHSANQRLLVVSFTERESRTRIIGAREATAQEGRDYEQNTQKGTT